VAAGEGRVGGYSGHGCDCKLRRWTAWGGGHGPCEGAELKIVNNPVPILKNLVWVI
jgi:hypothetical protein